MNAALRLVAGVIVAGAASTGFVELAHADSSSTLTLTPVQEAWYQFNPTCGSPAGCATTSILPAQPPGSLPNNPYPAGTMHIGLAPGQKETARAYLGFNLYSITGDVVGASIDVPVDTATADGSQAPESAKIKVCEVSDPVAPAAGSLDAPPAASCTIAVAAAYVATPTPHLHADLSRLSYSLLNASGLALLPDLAKAAPTDAWRLVFSAHTRTDAGKTPPAMLTVRVQQAATSVPQGTHATPVPGTNNSDLGGAAPLPSAVAPAHTAQLPVVATPAPSLQAASGLRALTDSYAYPVIWLLPIVFLLLVPAAANALTRDLNPAAQLPSD